METKKVNLRFTVLLGIVAVATVTRIFTPPLLGHPSNFSPIDAIALFSGCYFAGRLTKFIVPLLSVWVGDVFINYMYLHKLMLFYDGFYWQYGCYVLMTLLGSLLAYRVTPVNLMSASLSSSALFFVVSNFGVWVGSGMYPHTASGLVACYTAAIPFLSGTAIGDLIYSALFFGSFQWAGKRFPILALRHTSLK